MPYRLTLTKQHLIDLRYAIRYGILSDEESIAGIKEPFDRQDSDLIEQWKSNILRLQRLDRLIRRHLNT